MLNKHILKLLVLTILLALVMPPGPVMSPSRAALASDQRTPTTDLVVTTTDDETGECTMEYCSLRQAIEAANASEGSDTITFDIPTDDLGYDPETGQWTIALTSGPLPALGNPGTIIDATHPGDCSAYVILDATGVSYGLEITGTNQTVSGLVIKNAQTHGLYIHGSTAQSNALTCSYVVSSTVDGVHIASGASNNTIGSTSADQPNVIAYNGEDGIEITNSANNTVVNSYVGTDLAGMTAWPNGGYGVRISGGAMTNTVGLVQQGGNNLISGNMLGGVMISGGTTQGNVVQNNRIGTNSGGTAAIAGLDAAVINDGFVISSAPYNTIGPDNLISGNRRDGGRIEGGTAMYNVVKGNYIGTNADGDDKVTNRRFGIWLQDEAHHNTIGTETQGNLISGNGYDGDFAVAGGVAILGGSGYNTLCNNMIGTTAHGGALPNGGPGVRLSEGAQHNTFGYWTSAACGNTIAWNEGDGIYIHGSSTLYNTIYRNSIHDNDDLGINNESGGNRELFPPEILQCQTQSFGPGTRTVSLHARTCLTCTVMVYSDDGGEGRIFEGMVTSLDPTNGHFDWSGSVPLGSAFTLVAKDAEGNSSEFSAAPVKLSLSIDDALPHVVVNKVPGDSDAPAGNTTVDFVATIIGHDPSLRKDLDFELRLSSTVLGSPTRVFTRAQASDYNGTSISWSDLGSGVFLVQGIDLSPDTNSAGRWTQRVVFRFNVPHGASPAPLAAFGYLTADGRTLNQGIDYAAMQLLERADEVIITNRTQLYAQYDDQQTTTFLQNLYAFAQGPPFNWSPSSVVYYVDAYTPTLASWDNTTVSYASEGAANVAAELVDDLIEDWVEDSTTKYQKVCLPWFGCHQYPKDYPWYLLIAGDDNIIPFFRKDDPTDSESEHTNGGNVVLHALRANNYFFTDNYYGDLSYVFDLFPWNEGGVELAVGRLVGTRASHMSTLLHNGQYGPDTTHPARAIVGSGCGTDAQGAVNHFKNYGYDVLNDTESPSTVDNDSWQKSTLLTLMQGNYQIFHHGNHANEGEWTTPPCGDNMPGIDTNDIWSANVSNHIAANHPIFTSNGCRSGLSAAQADTNPLSFTTNEPTMVNALVREGASAVMASTGISFFDSDYGDVEGGEDFTKDFWGLAASPPPKQLNMGMALRWNKRTWDGHWSVDDEEEKTGAEFALYGIPWITAPYRGGTASPPLQASASTALSPPQPLGDQTYVVTATFDASHYSVSQVSGFDLVEVEGMVLARDTGVPLVPLAEAELQLPLGGSLVGVETIATNPVDLGTLNIPQDVPGVPIPGGDPGGLAEVPAIGVYPPQTAVSRTVALDGYEMARVYASPLSYNTTTDQATLYQSLALRITYHLSATVGLLDLTADPTDPAPGEPFLATATLVNPSDEPAALTGTLTLEDNLGEVVAVRSVDPFEVPPGGEQYSLELSWTAPITEGAYGLFLELWYSGDEQVMVHQALNVSGGRITALAVPDTVHPGQEAFFEVTFANRRGETFEGQVTLSIYDAEGTFVTTLDAPISVGAQGEATAGLSWDTEGMTTGTYVAAAEVTDEAESVTYGVIQEDFGLQYATYLPLVLRQFEGLVLRSY